jgi:hypothetical protein
MAVQLQDLYNKLLGLYNNYTEDGIPIAPEENADTEAKFILFADTEQKELWKYSKTTKQVEITNKAPINQLGLMSNFNIIDFIGETQYYPDEIGTKEVQGYSVKVDGDCIIAFEENIGGTWTDIITPLTPTSIDTLTLYKGVLAVSDTSNPVRMAISGTTHFRHKDRALWKVLYQADKVPEYAAWVKYDLPDDFNSIDEVVEEFPTRQYKDSANFKNENYRDYYFNFYFEGLIRITYKPIPTTLTALTDYLSIDDILSEAVMYGAAGKIGFYKNKDIVNYAEQRRVEAKAEATTDQPASEEAISNMYGGSGY